jgi:hypothetical protein
MNSPSCGVHPPSTLLCSDGCAPADESARHGACFASTVHSVAARASRSLLLYYSCAVFLSSRMGMQSNRLPLPFSKRQRIRSVPLSLSLPLSPVLRAYTYFCETQCVSNNIKNTQHALCTRCIHARLVSEICDMGHVLSVRLPPPTRPVSISPPQVSKRFACAMAVSCSIKADS